MTDSPPADVAAELTGTVATAARRLSGDVHVVDLADGTAVVVKRHREPGWARAEAASLAWLAVPGAPPVPGVRGHRDGWLVIDHVPPGRPSERAAEDFGRALAVLHAAGAPAFGSPPPGGPRDASIGLAPMRDVPGGEWPSWYAEHRVLPYVRTARDTGVLTAAEARVFEDACDRIEGLAGPPEPPARLHGDLWSGNVHWAADGRAWLVDASAHGGHRETDLAMLRLFGCPHLDRVLAAYRERAPLAPGWRERVPLHQLFPLLVHVVLFGRGYAAEALAAARA
ncbi:fructosamine kinase family protein [Umezawaea beigongshangensis]|uniref:fructosamine kinase family protein n=1 Tax=Umezawaea beigongshangensis TaxID=2780383 RepID=UPI0018F1F1E4|nr:fructosamine kinase family protein [Umezawaea beigongshangensis]